MTNQQQDVATMRADFEAEMTGWSPANQQKVRAILDDLPNTASMSWWRWRIWLLRATWVMVRAAWAEIVRADRLPAVQPR